MDDRPLKIYEKNRIPIDAKTLIKHRLYMALDSDRDKKGKQIVLQNKLLFRIVFDEMNTLTALLHQNSIRFAYLKGISLAIDVYAEPERRHVGDIDIFIAQKDREVVQSLLETAGYRLEALGSGSDMHDVYRKSVCSIEVHYNLFSPKYALINDAVFYDSIVDLTVSGVTLPVLGVQYRLLSLILHLLGHLFKYDEIYIHLLTNDRLESLLLYQWYDIFLFIEKYRKDIDWEGIIEFFRCYSLLHQYAIFERWFRELYPDVLPSIDIDYRTIFQSEVSEHKAAYLELLYELDMIDLLTERHHRQIVNNLFSRMPFEWFQRTDLTILKEYTEDGRLCGEGWLAYGEKELTFNLDVYIPLSTPNQHDDCAYAKYDSVRLLVACSENTHILLKAMYFSPQTDGIRIFMEKDDILYPVVSDALSAVCMLSDTGYTIQARIPWPLLTDLEERRADARLLVFAEVYYGGGQSLSGGRNRIDWYDVLSYENRVVL